MEDRKLLELAAKAAGIQILDWSTLGAERALVSSAWDESADGWWNPLSDDGDALRLSVKLRMEIEHSHPADGTMWVAVRAANERFSEVEEIDCEAQLEAATRRAIVRAAAEIGKAIP